MSNLVDLTCSAAEQCPMQKKQSRALTTDESKSTELAKRCGQEAGAAKLAALRAARGKGEYSEYP